MFKMNRWNGLLYCWSIVTAVNFGVSALSVIHDTPSLLLFDTPSFLVKVEDHPQVQMDIGRYCILQADFWTYSLWNPLDGPSSPPDTITSKAGIKGGDEGLVVRARNERTGKEGGLLLWPLSGGFQYVATWNPTDYASINDWRNNDLVTLLEYPPHGEMGYGYETVPVMSYASSLPTGWNVAADNIRYGRSGLVGGWWGAMEIEMELYNGEGPISGVWSDSTSLPYKIMYQMNEGDDWTIIDETSLESSGGLPPMLHIPNTYCQYYKTGGSEDCSKGDSFQEAWEKCVVDGSEVCMGIMWNSCTGPTSDTSVVGAWKLMTAGQDIGTADSPTSTCGGKDQALGHWDVYLLATPNVEFTGTVMFESPISAKKWKLHWDSTDLHKTNGLSTYRSGGGLHAELLQEW